jgi:Arc/MetJ-type ribon-helix-helix transcriptional regulator
MAKNPSRQITVRLEGEDVKTLEELEKAEQLNTSDVVRRAIRSRAGELGRRDRSAPHLPPGTRTR